MDPVSGGVGMGFREFYDNGDSRDGEFRHEVLNACLNAVTDKKDDILAYLALDLGIIKPECMLYYCSLIERPLKLAAGKAKNALRSSWEVPKAPYIISMGRTHYEPYGLVLIDPDRRMPFLHSFGVYMMSLALGNCTVFRFRGRETSTAAFLTDITNKCVPGNFGRIYFEGEECSISDPDLILGGFDYSAVSKNDKIGRAVAVFDALAEIDKNAEKVVYAWKKFSGLTEIAPEIVFVPNVLREKFVKNFNKWHRRKTGMEAPEKMPVIGYDGDESLWDHLEKEGKLAAFYVFSGDSILRDRLIRDIPFCTGCINGTSLRPPDLRVIEEKLVREKILTVK